MLGEDPLQHDPEGALQIHNLTHYIHMLLMYSKKVHHVILKHERIMRPASASVQMLSVQMLIHWWQKIHRRMH